MSTNPTATTIEDIRREAGKALDRICLDLTGTIFGRFICPKGWIEEAQARASLIQHLLSVINGPEADHTKCSNKMDQWAEVVEQIKSKAGIDKSEGAL